MVKQLLNSVIAKYRHLSLSRGSILPSANIYLLATNKYDNLLNFVR